METKGLKHLINEYAYKQPKRGQLLEGEILLIDEKMIYLDIGKKRDAIVPLADLDEVDEKRVENLSAGDQVPVYVTQPRTMQDELLVSISKGLEQEDWKRAEACLMNDELVELEVVAQNRGGLVVRFGLLQGFVPNSHLPDIRKYGKDEIRRVKKTKKIGTRMHLKAIEVDRDQDRLIFSAREAQEKRKDQRLRELEIGQVLEGVVINLVDFGAFVDLGGVDGLIHVSELAWERVNHPAEVLDVGDPVEVYVKDIDLERRQVGLSRKPLLPNPWDAIEDRYEIGKLVEGTITNVRDYGAFVRLGAGVEGLIHVSEMNVPSFGSPNTVFDRGDKVMVKVIEIDPYRKRIGLSLRQVPEEDQLPWMLHQWEQEINEDQMEVNHEPQEKNEK